MDSAVISGLVFDNAVIRGPSSAAARQVERNRNASFGGNMRTSFSVLGGATMCLSTVLAAQAQAPAQSQASLGEVLVTATRRETTLQETPLAISAFDQA